MTPKIRRRAGTAKVEHQRKVISEHSADWVSLSQVAGVQALSCQDAIGK